MSKVKIIDKKSIDNVIGEKEILSILHHPFIVNMIYTFQDREYLYLLMELLNGGNLRYHLNKKRKFQEDETSNNFIKYKNRIYHRMHNYRFKIYT
jgi:serine/threonine kinase 32